MTEEETLDALLATAQALREAEGDGPMRCTGITVLGSARVGMRIAIDGLPIEYVITEVSQDNGVDHLTLVRGDLQ